MIHDSDSYLVPYKERIDSRMAGVLSKRRGLAGKRGRLSRMFNNHLFYKLHKEGGDWVFREWAPNAMSIYVIGDFNGWKTSRAFAMHPVGNGNWELRLPLAVVRHGDLYKWLVQWPSGVGERLPSYATRCVQDPDSKVFSAQVWDPDQSYRWRYRRHPKISNPIIYETHIGMSSSEEKVSTYDEFRRCVLPRIADLGYNTIQIMALQEHPYYGSFGYHVSNFYALSSRFGTPEEFKSLVDEAHRLGIAVVMDIVHSHAVKNEAEGLGFIDGSPSRFFHEGERGHHPAWDSLCFDYGKDSTVFFLLSNLKFWMEEYHLDGFRFDGVTSMLYLDHGLGRDFIGYEMYFDNNQDRDAFTYLALANIVVKELNPYAITIAEDMSGMPGLASPLSEGGAGFDYRMSMGIADHWIKWIKELSDWDWSMGEIYWQLTDKRHDEKTISYAECHDQALVGDKTIIFRLIDKDMYTLMNKDSQSVRIERGIALHKMIRLVTAVTASDGYLNFMGNEFGHPEWIDFPRLENGWSYKYARRQWNLVDDKLLRYSSLNNFDRAMIHLLSSEGILGLEVNCLKCEEQDKVLVIKRGNFIFAFNFNPEISFVNYGLEVPSGRWKVVLDSDSRFFGGFGRNASEVEHLTCHVDGKEYLYLYLPSRTAIVLRKT